LRIFFFPAKTNAVVPSLPFIWSVLVDFNGDNLLSSLLLFILIVPSLLWILSLSLSSSAGHDILKTNCFLFLYTSDLISDTLHKGCNTNAPFGSYKIK